MPGGFQYRLALRTEEVGGWRFDLVGIEDFEATVTDLAGRVGRELDPRWFEELCPMFGVVWPSARALARQVVGADPRGRRVLELGCGLALPSLVAARAGAEVVATDQHPDAERFLTENLERNRLDVRYVQLDWSGPAPPEVPARGFDLVLASDVLYASSMPGLLAATLDRFLADEGIALVADPGRPWLQDFADAARERGLSVHVDVDGEVFVLQLRRAREADQERTRPLATRAPATTANSTVKSQE